MSVAQSVLARKTRPARSRTPTLPSTRVHSHLSASLGIGFCTTLCQKIMGGCFTAYLKLAHISGTKKKETGTCDTVSRVPNKADGYFLEVVNRG
jgi:hypothetical protein